MFNQNVLESSFVCTRTPTGLKFAVDGVQYEYDSAKDIIIEKTEWYLNVLYDNGEIDFQPYFNNSNLAVVYDCYKNGLYP